MSKIGEVIESTTNSYVAEAYELYDLPAFGSLVKIVDSTWEIYGVICHAATASIEPGRRPVARGKEEAKGLGFFMPERVLHIEVYLDDSQKLNWVGQFQGKFFPSQDLGMTFMAKVAEMILQVGGEMGVFKKLEASTENLEQNRCLH